MKMNIKKVLVLGTALTIMASASVFAAPKANKLPQANNGKPNIEQSQKGSRGDKKEDFKAKKGSKEHKEQKPNGGKAQHKRVAQPRK